MAFFSFLRQILVSAPYRGKSLVVQKWWHIPCMGVGKQRHQLLSHLALAEPKGFSWGTQTNKQKVIQWNQVVASQSSTYMVSELVGVLSPVNHYGLYLSWKQTSIHLLVTLHTSDWTPATVFLRHSHFTDELALWSVGSVSGTGDRLLRNSADMQTQRY